MKNSKLLFGAAAIAGVYTAARIIANKHTEDESIDKDNPYLDDSCVHEDGDAEKDNKNVARSARYVRPERQRRQREKNVYETSVKPALDQVLSFGGLVALSPLYAAIALAIKIDDPGPVFFTQKRVGKDGRFFMLHKYRSMKMSTPHDVPTHQLKDSDQYITRVGRILRKTSLDELPQFWDIFRGKMSIIGPRPALWNQEDLVAEREKWGANRVLPGLTGLAQIKGRDELEIPDKARLDGEYVGVLKEGGLKAFFFDGKIFFNTVASVVRHDGVVEGGTGSLPDPADDFQTVRTRGLRPVDPADVGFEDYGYKKSFHIDKNRKIKVLITGAGSYIGESFKIYCGKYYPNIEITTIDMVDGSWREASFEGYDTVFHVAGIAHADVGNVDRATIDKYYAVNTDLAIETAKKSLETGVKQFIFMSSMIIYGEAEYIDEHTMPAPVNFYGDSKWQADRGVRKLSTDSFRVAVLRPPMIYGKGSKGNYPTLSKIARKVPIFPEYENTRSMLYIENLCEFAAQLSLSQQSGVYFPQNGEYSNTSELVASIGMASHSPVRTSKVLSSAVSMAKAVPIGKIRDLAKKAFGSSYYDQRISHYDGLDYQKVALNDSITRTEG